MRRLAPLLLVLACAPRVAAAPDVQTWIQALGSPDPRRRAEAAVILGGVQAPQEKDAILAGLARVLEDRRPEVRREAALALGRRGDRRAAGPLARRAQRELRTEVLPVLLLSLGDLGGSEHLAVVGRFATTDARSQVRAAAYTALGRLGGVQARQWLLDAVERQGLDDRDWSLRAAAILALARAARPEDVGRVLMAFREGDGGEHWFARSALARFVSAKDPDPVPTLRRMVGDPDPRVAVTAAVGLARAGHLEEVLRLLRHVVPGVRAAAVSAVGQARVAVGYARLRTLSRLDPAREVRWAAALALFRIEDPFADELVVQAVAASEPAIWAEALAALAERTGERHGRDREAWRAALARHRSRR